MKEFSKKMDFFINSNAEMKACVRKFDETMMLKANKSMFSIIKQEIQDKYVNNDRWN